MSDDKGRNEIELLAESVCMNHLKDRELPCPSCKMITRAIRTQVKKARAEAYENAIKIIECHHVDEECPDHELADCTYRIIEEIRNKLEKE